MNEKKVQLEYKLKQGDVTKYKTIVEASTEITGEGQTKSISSVMEMITTQTIIGMFPDGAMKAEVSINSASLRRNGEEIPVPNIGQTMQIKMKRNGEIFQMSEGTSGGQSHASLPDDQVGIGDRWSGENPMEIPGTGKTVVLKTDHTLESFEKMKGYECAKINVSTPETVIPLQEDLIQTMVVTGTTYFACNEGKLVQSIAETETWMTLPSGQTVDSLTRMTIEIESNNIAEEYSFSPDNDFIMPSI